MAQIRLLPPKGTRALLAIDGPASATFNTIVEAADAYEGPAGNAVTLTLTAGGTGTGAITVAGTAVTFTYETAVTTVADFEAALAAHTEASALMRVKTAGTTQAYALLVGDDDFSATNLTGGGSVTVAAPTLTSATAGVAIGMNCDQALVLVRTVDTTTSIVKTATPILWGYCGETGYWYSLGTLNAGSAIAETTADAINYAEVVTGLRGITRLYAQQAVGGTGTETEIVVIPCRAETVTH